MNEKEYILRADVLWLIYSGKIMTGDNAEDSAQTLVKDIPAADVRPVVLCKDCMMRQYCKVAQHLGADGFCSNGEKREES